MKWRISFTCGRKSTTCALISGRPYEFASTETIKILHDMVSDGKYLQKCKGVGNQFWNNQQSVLGKAH